jgi:2-dehydro-3-deoxygluconokinase
MTYDLFTLGETMLRFSPAGTARLEAAAELGVFVGGAESNVAVAAARMGKRVAWFSRLPAAPPGLIIANALRAHGVDVSLVQWAEGERVGLYYVEFAAPPRGIRVWYDRANSAASRMSPADLPLEAISHSRWLHLTGITPALSESCQAATEAALQHAKASGVRVSFDVNYRARLWPPTKAAACLDPLCAQADLALVALRDAHNLFGAPNDPTEAARALAARWGGTVVVTAGELGVWAYQAGEVSHIPAFNVIVTDRLGAGDAFAAGLLTRLLEDAPLPDALRFGAALAALKLTIAGDLPLVSRSEVEALLVVNREDQASQNAPHR